MKSAYLIAALVAAAVVLVTGPVFIPLLHRLKFGQTEREEGPESHKAKQGTPTMGGLMTMLGIVIATLCFSLKGAAFSIPALLVTVAFGVVGFLDDFIKVHLKRNLGLRAWQKIVFQFGLALAIAFWAYFNKDIGHTVYLPFSGRYADLGWFYIPLIVVLVVGTTNAVNLTDGLDGLASSVTIVYAVAMCAVFAILAGSAATAGETAYGEKLSSMAVFAAAVAGASLGFLRFNCFPARVFMGDTGSLALGGAVAMMAIISRGVLLLPVMGFCFVGSALSVILQVGSYKLRKGKRIFKMAPIHHHFELMGYPETKIVSMYTLVTIALCVICLISYTR